MKCQVNAERVLGKEGWKLKFMHITAKSDIAYCVGDSGDSNRLKLGSGTGVHWGGC
jgi:hypothetical protein